MTHKKIVQTLKTLILFLAILALTGPSLAGQPQIEIDSVIGPERDAIQIKYAERFGFFVYSAGVDGVHVSSAGDDGVFVGGAGDDGVFVGHAGGDGVSVNSAGGHSMNIQGVKSASTLEGHIGLVYNRDNGTNADVLALKVATTGNPAASNNFITFYNGADVSLGAVEGNGSGGISYTSSGSDYAEYLPLLDRTETFSPGDIAGVYGGHISKQTANAQRVMVITDQAAVIGNKPVSTGDDAEIEGYETVSFIGQVRTMVRGKVQAGDWIVASGTNDGTGVAMAATDIGLNHQIVGRAWESSSGPGVKRINTAVGLDHSEVKDNIIHSVQQEVVNLKTQIDELQNQVNALTRAIAQNSEELQIYGKLQLTNTDLNK